MQTAAINLEKGVLRQRTSPVTALPHAAPELWRRRRCCSCRGRSTATGPRWRTPPSPLIPRTSGNPGTTGPRQRAGRRGRTTDVRSTEARLEPAPASERPGIECGLRNPGRRRRQKRRSCFSQVPGGSAALGECARVRLVTPTAFGRRLCRPKDSCARSQLGEICVHCLPSDRIFIETCY